MKQILTFDEMFLFWLEAEINQIEGRNLLSVAKQKGFSSITEWRLSTALRLGLDKLSWRLVDIKNPSKTLPKIIIGPYQGWSIFFKNKLTTTFVELVKIPEARNWLKTHDRINPIRKNFPKASTIILLQKPNGDYIHIEGGHRICAVSYAQTLGKPIKFGKQKSIQAAVAKISNAELTKLKKFLKQGTNKKPR